MKADGGMWFSFTTKIGRLRKEGGSRMTESNMSAYEWNTDHIFKDMYKNNKTDEKKWLSNLWSPRSKNDGHKMRPDRRGREHSGSQGLAEKWYKGRMTKSTMWQHGVMLQIALSLPPPPSDIYGLNKSHSDGVDDKSVRRQYGKAGWRKFHKE